MEGYVVQRHPFLVTFPYLHNIAGNRKVWVLDYLRILDDGMVWELRFNIVVKNWELEMVEDFFLGSTRYLAVDKGR